jgi:hypothetical protein
MVAEAVYILCTLTSAACAVLLLRGYVRSRARLLLWSGLCFILLALNNVLLFMDKVIFPDIDFWGWRTGTAVAGLALLTFGLIWEAD